MHDVLRSPGRPLDASTRRAFEERFGHDFSQVRVHAGQQLLAHELGHVVQQRAARPSSELMVDDHHEHSAPATVAVQRQPASKPEKAGADEPADLKVQPGTHTISRDEIDKEAEKKKEEEKPEASVKLDALAKKVTTNLEVSIPWEPWLDRKKWGQRFVVMGEPKAEFELGPPASGVSPLQQQLAIKISMKALSLDLESVKARIPGMKELGADVSGEAGIDPKTPLAAPDLALKASIGASYQPFRKVPLFLEGKIGYQVQFPANGPAKVMPGPLTEFGLKFVLP